MYVSVQYCHFQLKSMIGPLIFVNSQMPFEDCWLCTVQATDYRVHELLVEKALDQGQGLLEDWGVPLPDNMARCPKECVSL